MKFYILIVFYTICVILITKLVFQKKLNKNEQFYNKKYVDKKKLIKILIRQCARWAVASQQDNSPLVMLLHANYASGYLWAIKDIATDKEIEEVIKMDVLKFVKKIVKIQDNATRKALTYCPDFGKNLNMKLLKLYTI